MGVAKAAFDLHTILGTGKVRAPLSRPTYGIDGTLSLVVQMEEGDLSVAAATAYIFKVATLGGVDVVGVEVITSKFQRYLSGVFAAR